MPDSSPTSPRRQAGAGLLRAAWGRLRAQGDGPPDLDELWKDFNRRLGQMFGNKGSGDSGNGNGGAPGGGPGLTPDPRSAGVGLGLVAGVVVLFWFGSGVFIVQEGQQAVVTTFGEYSKTVDAGMQMRLPYPFQAHETVPVTQLRSVSIGRDSVNPATGLRDSAMLTQDENIVDVRFAVQYRLKDARSYLFENARPDDAVILASESAVREIVGRSKVDAVLTQRDAIAADLVKLIQLQLDKLKAGIIIANVNVKDVQVPEQVQAAFNDAVKAGADRDRYKNEGQAYASDVIPDAQGKAARLHEDALAWKAHVVATAEGDAERFRSVLTEYQKAPAVTRDRMYVDTMQQVYSSVTKVMVESRNGNNLVNIPLEKLLQANQAAAQSQAASPAPVSVPTPPSADAATADGRSRESSRTRDAR